MTRDSAKISRSRLSLALRVAIASALFGLAVAGGAIVVGFWALSYQLDERFAAEIQGRRNLLEHILSTIPSVQAVATSESRFGDLFYGHDDLHLALVESGTGRVLARFSDVAVQSVTVLRHAEASADTVHAWVTPSGARFSGIHGTAPVADGRQIQFYLSVDRHSDAALLDGFVKATLVALPLLLLIVAAHRGSVSVRSDQGRTTFTLAFPQSREIASQAS